MFEQLVKYCPILPDIPQGFGTDARTMAPSHWLAIAAPYTTNHIQALFEYARTTKTPIVPVAGQTGLVGGATFQDPKGAIALTLRNFQDIEMSTDSVLVGAGVVLDVLHEKLAPSEKIFPLQLASGGSAQVGGLISTNAGGIRTLRYGSMGALVQGLRAVFPDGTVYNNTNALQKNNTGYPIDRFLIGAEGTLGVITHARLRLFHKDSATRLVFAPVEDPQAALDLLGRLQNHPIALSAFELIDGTGLAFRLETGFEPDPLGAPRWSVLFEIGGEDTQLDAVLSSLGQDLNQAIVAQNTTQTQKLWHVRETIPLANHRIGSICSHDISLPISKTADFIESISQMLCDISPDVRINAFGHLGDGSLHFNLFAAHGKQKTDYPKDVLSRIIYKEVVAYQGSIAAEHGIGRHKAQMLDDYGLKDKKMIMRKIKDALDPEHILNPGVFF